MILHAPRPTPETVRSCWPFAVALLLVVAAARTAGQDASFTFSTFAGAAGTVVNSKVTPAGVVTTLAGTAGAAGRADGAGGAAQFRFPSHVAVNSAGDLFVTDTDNQAVRRITPAGVVTTVGGGSMGTADGVGTAAQFRDPKGIAADRQGRLYVADRGNRTIRVGAR